MVEDYILWCLTGEFATCRGMLPSTEYYDIRTTSWYAPMLEFLGITEENLPRLTDAGECAGIVKENDSLLPAGCVVTLCPIDHVCGNLGSGCCENGMISDKSYLSVSDAKKNTMAYSILTSHNTSGNDEKLKIKFDAMASHDITYVGIIPTARASGLKEFPLPYVLTNCHNSLCAVGGTI